MYLGFVERFGAFEYLLVGWLVFWPWDSRGKHFGSQQKNRFNKHPPKQDNLREHGKCKSARDDK